MKHFIKQEKIVTIKLQTKVPAYLIPKMLSKIAKAGLSVDNNYNWYLIGDSIKIK